MPSMNEQAGYTRGRVDAGTLGEVAAFVSAQTGGWMGVERVIEVITTIAAGPEAVLDLQRQGRRAGVAIVIDTCSTEGDAAELSVFVDEAAIGASSSAGGAEETLDNLLAWAEERVAGGPRSNLDLPIWPGTTVPEPWLRRHGFAKIYTYFEMERDGGEGAPILPQKPLPPGLAWHSYEERFFSSFFETLRRAFAGVHGTFIPGEEASRERTRGYPVPPSLLMQGERVAGYVRVEIGSNGSGEIASLGRHPDYRGLGIGEHLVRRGIEMLSARGVRQQRLEVTARNARAIELYERFGFRRCREYAVYRRPIRPPEKA